MRIDIREGEVQIGTKEDHLRRKAVGPLTHERRVCCGILRHKPRHATLIDESDLPLHPDGVANLEVLAHQHAHADARLHKTQSVWSFPYVCPEPALVK